MTMPTQGKICHPNADASHGTSVQNLKSLALAIPEIF